MKGGIIRWKREIEDDGKERDNKTKLALLYDVSICDDILSERGKKSNNRKRLNCIVKKEEYEKRIVNLQTK
jgi:hypothetical protein